MCDCSKHINSHKLLFLAHHGISWNQQEWWAYRHKNGEIKLKRWWPPSDPKSDCDCCYAAKEQREGNDFIDVISHVFLAYADEAMTYAEALLTGRPVPKVVARWPHPEPSPEDRWKDIEL